MVAFSDFYESHGPPPSGDARGIVPAHRHRHGHRNGQQSGHILQYGVTSRPMAVFSGFYESPGPPSSSDACGIAPPHRHGNRNGLRGRCFCSLSPPFLPGIIVAKAKDHHMVHLN
jgi:hypothetical protein